MTNTRAWMLAMVIVAVLSAGLYSQTALPSPKPREPSWAFQVQEGSLPAESPEPKTIPGSTRKYTPKEIDDLNAPPDWFPDQHPPAPDPVMKGRPGVLACGGCHLMSGLGHPESADVTGFTAAYFTQQMMDFRSGARQDFAARMNAFAKGLSEDEIKQVAEYFAKLPRHKFVRVVEAAMVPKTFVGQGRMRFVDPKQTGMEPIGNRIITLPENQELARWRDPRPSAGFVSYVPPGSIKRGQLLAVTGGGGKTITCSFCHGDGLKGLGNVPRIAGLHPIYVARQLIIFKEGLRNGPDAALMKKPVGQLTEADIIDLSAYVGSLNPE
jgi:cytochrome c553